MTNGTFGVNLVCSTVNKVTTCHQELNALGIGAIVFAVVVSVAYGIARFIVNKKEK